MFLVDVLFDYYQYKMYAEMVDCQMSLVDVLFDFKKHKMYAEMLDC